MRSPWPISAYERLSPRRQLALLPVPFALAVVCVLGYSALSAPAMHQDVARINVAGRQRMLAERYAREVLQALRPGSPPMPQNTRDVLLESADVLLRGGAAPAVTDGERETPLGAVPSGNARSVLAEERNLMFRLASTGDQCLRLAPGSPDAEARLAELFSLESRIQESCQEDQRLLVAQSGSHLLQVLALQALLALFFVALGLQGCRIVLHTQSRELSKLAAAAQAVSLGDLNTRLEESGPDEVGALARALNSMLGSLSDILNRVGRSARGLGESSRQLAASGDQMSHSAESTSRQAGTVSAAASQVSLNARQVARSAGEMSASILNIAENANAAAGVASGAVKVAETANATVAQLGRSSAEIGKVIKVITSIAEQTNLLALNAAIEAARAGDAGRGFAVVANEVKELAVETARATDEIGDKIEAIQQDARAAIAAISHFGEVITQVNEISGTIATAVEEQTATTDEISRNADQAAQSSTEIAENITLVAGAAQQTTSAAEDTRAAAAELLRLADELQRVLSQFRQEDRSSGISESPVAVVRPLRQARRAA